MQCPKCGVTWEGPDGANEKQFCIMQRMLQETKIQQMTETIKPIIGSQTNLMDYLGGDPTVEVKNAEYSQDSKKMLEIDLRQEQETFKNYRE